MKILSVSPYPILPLSHGGRVRAFRLAVGLARAGAEVTVMCPWTPAFPVHPFEREGVLIRPLLLAASVLPVVLGDRIVSPLVQLSFQPRTRLVRRVLADARGYDVVDFHFCAYAEWVEGLAGGPRVVYSAHNVESEFARSRVGSRLATRLVARVASLERRMVEASDLVVCVTEQDAAAMSRLYEPIRSPFVVPNGFPREWLAPRAFPPRAESRARLGLGDDELAVVFVGGPALHNRRAARFLETDVLPKLAVRARLVVAGGCLPARRGGRVLALGDIPDVRTVLAAADVAANPVDMGSGSNVKLVEYVAAGLPTVTTALGLRGYEDLADVVTVAELDDFAAALDPARRLRPDRSRLVGRDWDSLAARLHDVYSGLDGDSNAARKGESEERETNV